MIITLVTILIWMNLRWAIVPERLKVPRQIVTGLTTTKPFGRFYLR